MKNTLFQRIKKKNYFIIAEIGNNHEGNINMNVYNIVQLVAVVVVMVCH